MLNLIQIKERLKGLPIQQVMAYANGANRIEVPPDMALGELLRRKEMEQNAQMPQGTVKDRIEQDVMQQQMALMQTQMAKMQAGAQQQQQQAVAQAPAAPPGTPEPVQAARGGIMGLPSDFKFAPGGIVAFAEGSEGAVGDPMGTGAAETANVEPSESGMSALRKALLRYSNVPQWKIEAMEEQARRGTRARTEPPKREAKAEEEVAPPAPAPAPRPMPVATGGGERQPAVEDFMAMAARYLKQSEQTPLPKSYEQRMEEERARAGSPLAKPALAGYEEFLSRLEAADQQRSAAAAEREKRRQAAEFFTALSAGAEGSRGQRGIGALLGSVGKQLGGVQMAALERADKLAEIERDQAMKMAELRAKIEESRRAEARGDLKAKADADMDIAKLQREIQANRLSAAANLSQVQEMARARAATTAQSNRDSLFNLASILKQEDPSLSNKSALEAAARIKSGAAFERTNVANMEAYRKAVADVDKKYPLLKVGKDTPQYRAELEKRNAEVRALQEMYGITTGATGAGAPKIDTSQVKSVTEIK